MVAKIATGETEDDVPTRGREGGRAGGRARASSLSAKQRSQIAKKAADSRWKKIRLFRRRKSQFSLLCKEAVGNTFHDHVWLHRWIADTRILWLALLAPEVVETILAGRTDHALMLGRLERPLPASWEEQQEQIVWTLTGKLT